jgi:DNA (cytosine-5)-methyltransferase 1
VTAYYNEHDPKAAAWLRELIANGHIAPGDVDGRSIADLAPADLVGYTQHHFFAGIGGWSLALRLAGWPDERPVWTGSCPCQPFSAAGKGAGGDDPRHLWPVWFRLVKECRPDTVFGEQVAGAIRHGWLDLLQTDLEAEGYAIGHCVLGAHSVGAPHLRQRLYWVAESEGAGGCWRYPFSTGYRQQSGGSSPTGGLADAEHAERGAEHVPGEDGRNGSDARREEAHGQLGTCGEVRGLGHANEPGPQGYGRYVAEHGSAGRENEERHDSPHGFWSDLEWLPCRDGKTRPTQPGLFPLAHGVSGRVGLLRGYGNAIVPQSAATFIQAYLSV